MLAISLYELKVNMDKDNRNVLIFWAAVVIAPSLLVSCSTKYDSKLEASRAA